MCMCVHVYVCVCVCVEGYDDNSPLLKKGLAIDVVLPHGCSFPGKVSTLCGEEEGCG